MRLHIGLTGNTVFVLELTSKTATNHRQRLAVEVLAQLKKLVESQAVTLIVVGIKTEIKGVVPTVFVEFAVFDGADGVFPLITALQIRTFNDATARKTENARFHIAQRLRQILAHTVFATHPSVNGEERNVFQVGGNNRLLVKTTQENPHRRLGVCNFALELCGVLLPLAAVNVHVANFLLLNLAHRCVVNNLYKHRRLAALGTTRPNGKPVLLAFLDVDAEEALILNAGVLVRMSRIAEPYIMRTILKGAILPHLNIAERPPAHQSLWKLKRAVLDHFGVQTTVRRKIDVLEKDAVHRTLHRRAGLCGVDFHHVALRRCSESRRKRKRACQ